MTDRDWAAEFWDSFDDVKLDSKGRARANALVDFVAEDPDYAAYIIVKMQQELEGEDDGR